MSTHLESPRIGQQLHILQHSLGLDEFGRGRSYRSYFVTGPGYDDWDDCNALADAGLMWKYPPSEIAGWHWTFYVTNEGRKFVREHSPTPPKLTRSQRRYRDYLANDGCMRFGEWLKATARIGRGERTT